MPKNYFTNDEIVLCAYAALYDENEFGGINAIRQITQRPISSISMKIRNIASKLDEERISRNNRVTPLTGTPQGSKSRSTNWDIVEPLTRKSKRDFQAQCQAIITNMTLVTP
jgi:hypothetical protein